MTCRLCGGKNGRFLLFGKLTYNDCPECRYLGLAARHFPDPASEERRYRLHRNDPADSGYRKYLEAFIDAALLPFLAEGESILDFGSGPLPALSLILEERGFRPTAYDPIFAPSTAWKRRRWKTIVVHEVAEHLRAPRRTLASLVRRLEPGGILAIRTRFAPESERELEKWWYRLDSTHVGFFRLPSFSAFARDLDLEPLLVEAPDIAVLRLDPLRQ